MSDIMKEYISVAEFSKRINESKAKAYSIIEQEQYNKYVSIIDGTKRVSPDLVEFYLNGFIEVPIDDIEDIFNKEKDNKLEPKEEIDIDYIYLLEQQNKKIEELERQIQEKDKVILDYANKFAEMATQAQNIAVSALNTTGQAQYLQATQQQEKQSQPTEIVMEEVKPTVKKSLIQRLFGK